MKVYLWKCQGRLGNQVIQYEFIRRYIENNSIVLYLDNSLNDLAVLEKNFIALPVPFKKRSYKIISGYFNFILNFVVKIGFLSLIEPNTVKVLQKYISEDDSLKFKRGFLQRICVISGFFQFLDLTDLQLNFRHKYRMIYDSCSYENNYSDIAKCAIHIRAGDYEVLSVLGKRGAVVSSAWYQRVVDVLDGELKNVEFYVFTDNSDLYKEISFRGMSYIVSSEDELTDFVKFAAFKYAIISHSSYSLCAASLSGLNKIIYAPRYWLGFKSNVWMPHKIENSFINYV